MSEERFDIHTQDGVSVPCVMRPRRSGSSRAVVLAHGITAEKTEGGIFDRAASALIESGFDTLQFDFRGHGESGVRSTDMTIKGEVLDLTAVLEHLVDHREISLLAASFGAVSTCYLPVRLKERLSRLVLWNPVLSLHKTFIEPELPWQLANFGERRIQQGIASGKLLIDDTFEVGPAFLAEVEGLEPTSMLNDFKCAMLVIHGDRDTYVSYDEARRQAERIDQAAFVSVPGAEHGFGRPEEERYVIAETVKFLSGRSEP